MQVKMVSCPNCGIIHKVVDLCRSEISNKDEARTLITIDDVKVSLSEPLAAILEKHEVGISVWEHARWIVENESWGTFVPLEHERVSGGKNVKIMTILGKSLFRIETKFVGNEIA